MTISYGNVSHALAPHTQYAFCSISGSTFHFLLCHFSQSMICATKQKHICHTNTTPVSVFSSLENILTIDSLWLSPVEEVYFPIMFIYFYEYLRMQSWWQMETFFALLALSEENPPVTGGPPHKGQWRRALKFSLVCAWTDSRANNRDAGDIHPIIGVDVIAIILLIDSACETGFANR